MGNEEIVYEGWFFLGLNFSLIYCVMNCSFVQFLLVVLCCYLVRLDCGQILIRLRSKFDRIVTASAHRPWQRPAVVGFWPESGRNPAAMLSPQCCPRQQLTEAKFRSNCNRIPTESLSNSGQIVVEFWPDRCRIPIGLLLDFDRIITEFHPNPIEIRLWFGRRLADDDLDGFTCPLDYGFRWSEEAVGAPMDGWMKSRTNA